MVSVFDECGCFGIAQMSAPASDPVFKLFGVVAAEEHFGVIIGFEDGMGGEAEEGLQGGGDIAYIGGQEPLDVSGDDEIAGMVDAVMREVKGGDGEGVEREGDTFGDVMPGVGVHLASETRAGDGLEDGVEAEDGDGVPVEPGADAADMIVMVMSEEQSAEAVPFHSCLFEAPANGSDANAGIDEQSLPLMHQAVTVAAAAGSQADEPHIAH
jgi:hypothetical protein